jgi:hypothetical protein
LKSDELIIDCSNSIKAFLKPSSITSFLLKSILNGLDISIFSISKDFASNLTVEKKNIFRDRNIK